MKVGFASMNNPDHMRPDVLARELEARGFDSLWLGEHSHIPVEQVTPFPGGGELPQEFLSMMDPFLGLLLAATATEHLILGTAVALPLQHDLFFFAKTVATLDLFCGGRLELGVGAGWNEEEMADHTSVPWAKRYRALDECVAALRALWTDDPAEFHGKYYDFDPAWSRPKPLQRPHPPVICGVSGKVGRAHALAWADGWMPLDVRLVDVAKRVGWFRQSESAAGREPMPITLHAMAQPTLATLEHYRELGIHRVVVVADAAQLAEPGRTLAFLDRYAAMIPALT